MLTLPVEEWIGNAAAVLSGVWGAVTHRSEQSGYSRTAIYQHAERVVQAVANEQTGGISYEDLWAEHERLKAENEALWQAWSEAEDLSESKQRELASAGSAMGLSLTQIVILLAIVLPSRLVPSRATVGRWVQQSAQQSRGILEVLDRACQRWVLVLCLDEIFFHREPILMGVEPISLAWLAAQRGPDRSGESGCKVMSGVGLTLIEAWPNLEHVIADGGQGLERGVKLANEARSQAQEPESDAPAMITMGLDVFHTEREFERVLQRLGNRGERQIDAAGKADAKLAQAKRRGQDPRGLAGSAGRAWRKAERLFDEAVQAQEGVEQIKEALGWFDASGHLYSRERAQAQLDAALQLFQGESWSKGKRMLKDARTLSHSDRLHEQLDSAVPEPMLREALIHLWYLSRLMKRAEGEDRVRLQEVVVLEQVFCGRLCSDWREGYVKVDELLRQAVRASSAVEGVNSVVRMHQGRHRHVSQEMLDLKRLYWNCRVFREGKRKGQSPYELLGLKLPTSDWWQLLQMDPQELEQKLLTQ
jgi:hypothetical protein